MRSEVFLNISAFPQGFEIDKCRQHLQNFPSVVLSKIFTEWLLWAEFSLENVAWPEMPIDKGLGFRGNKWSFTLISMHQIEERAIM